MGNQLEYDTDIPLSQVLYHANRGKPVKKKLAEVGTLLIDISLFRQIPEAKKIEWKIEPAAFHSKSVQF